MSFLATFTSRLNGRFNNTTSKSLIVGLVSVVLLYVFYVVWTRKDCIHGQHDIGLHGRSLGSSRCFSGGAPSQMAMEVMATPSSRMSTEDSQCLVKQILKNVQMNEYYVNCRRIVYNRVPKCGSRTVLSTFKILSRILKYNVIGMEKPSLTYNYYKKKGCLTSFVRNFTEFESPFIFSQHVHYIDFSKFSVPSPVFINVIRNPTERLISHYYYRMYGSSNKPVSQLTVKFNKTIDECVQSGKGPCFKINEVIPFFCGHEKQCRTRSSYALTKAKRVVAENFLVIGFTEDLTSFMEVLEFLLPNYFANAVEVFKNVSSALQDKTKTAKKPDVQPETMAKLQEHLTLEYDFYNFARQRFYNLLKQVRTMKQDGGRTQYFKNKRHFFKWWKKTGS